MKRLLKIISVAVVFSGLAFPQQATTPAQGKQQNQPKPAPDGQPMHKQHMQMMQQMQADMDSMRATLQKMKSQVPKVSDTQVRQYLQLETSMWESLLKNMDAHMTMMKSMMEGHQSMMQDHGGHSMGPQMHPHE